LGIQSKPFNPVAAILGGQGGLGACLPPLFTPVAAFQKSITPTRNASTWGRYILKYDGRNGHTK
jgi:hypothetical protein